MGRIDQRRIACFYCFLFTFCLETSSLFLISFQANFSFRISCLWIPPPTDRSWYLFLLVIRFHTCSSETSKESFATMAVAFYDLSSAAGLKKLDDYLLTRSYITGYQASKDDITVFSAISKSPAEYVNVSRWYKHIDALLRISGVTGEGSGVIVEGSAPITGEAVATPPVEDSKAVAAAVDDDDDDVDLFGEETEEEKKAAEERAAAVKASSKKKESGKSSVLMDVKPWDDETDMKKLEEAVRSVQMEGLFWGASKLVPVGYGIKKLQIMLTIVDDLVSVDHLIEEYLTVEPINEYVQSCDIVAFNKI
uniref:Elongation factor 1-beta n=1 Tax=Stellera chamaejasme TaxID=142738 RepID=A0A2R4A6T9_9ROSI|nr:elongation factor 1-beta [Stellera chamaejasme]